MHVDEHGTQMCTDDCPLALTLIDGEPRSADFFLHHRLGHRVPVQAQVLPQCSDDGQIVGALEVFRETSSEEELREELERLRAIALVDPLTGLANRRHLDEHLSARASQLDRFGWSFGVILFDIDHFKAVNDTYGHLVGDQALTVVARDLLSNARSTDLVGRWGGEEFMIVAVNTDAAALHAAAERFRVMIGASFVHTEQGDITVTASAGATVASKEESVQEVVARADQALYEAKRGGRNRVVTTTV